jgi:PmbA protein
MERIINLLNNNKKVDEWMIKNTMQHSTELFFVKDELQMNRSKDVQKISLTVYKNFEIDGNKFKGSSVVNINPTDSVEDIENKINTGILAASFVKNQYYPLTQPVDDKAPEITSDFAKGDVVDTICKVVDQIYKDNHKYNADINSAEFFITISDVTIINSNGVNVHFPLYNCEIEIITEADGEEESIELFDIINFSNLDKEYISEKILTQLEYTSLRAKAKKTPKLNDIPVILRGSAIHPFWTYYLNQASANSKHQHLHDNNVNDNIQGEDIIGDKLTIIAKPVIEGSVDNGYYDSTGFFLKEYPLYEEGILKTLHGSTRFASYLGIEPTGAVRNIEVIGGKFTEAELKKEPYLEVVSFSAFQMDAMTGFFGGEFRLAIYFDGENYIPLSHGAVQANIKEAQKEMFLSKETSLVQDTISPKAIKFNKMTIVGGN